MAKGPAPTPAKLRIMRGNPGKRPLPKDEPQPKEGTPAQPAWLSRAAKDEWRRIVPELRKLGLLTLVDRAALASYCQAWAELADATAILNKEGRIIDQDMVGGGTRKRLHPAVELQHDAFARVKSFVVEFGLTPASRTRIQAKPEEQEKDDLAEFMSG